MMKTDGVQPADEYSPEAIRFWPLEFLDPAEIDAARVQPRSRLRARLRPRLRRRTPRLLAAVMAEDGLTVTQQFHCDRGHSEQAVFVRIVLIGEPDRAWCIRCAIDFFDQHLGKITDLDGEQIGTDSTPGLEDGS